MSHGTGEASGSCKLELQLALRDAYTGQDLSGPGIADYWTLQGFGCWLAAELVRFQGPVEPARSHVPNRIHQ